MSIEMERGEAEKRPAKTLSETFDLTGDKKIASYVARFEELFRVRQSVNADLKQLADDAVDDMLKKREVEAIKKIAKWRCDDKLGAAQELFIAMSRVARATKIDLFSWMDAPS